MRSDRRSFPSLCLAAATALAGLAAAPPAGAVVATFSVRFEDKLFINTIPLASCGPGAVLGFPGPNYPAQLAAYLTFCKATSLGENPPNGAIVAPLDARIRGGVDVTWRCDTTALPKPVGPTGVAPLAGAGGPEGPLALGLKGIVNVTPVRDQIAANTTFGAVVSGHPNPWVEPLFQAQRLRARPDIWNKLTGAITCGVDGRGMPTSTVNLTLLSTLFPSHRVWYRAPIAAPGPGALIFNVPQGAFSALWFLPA
ncbi:MAG: hypothetical protein ABI655_00665, partial [Phenylobacterium sp.]